MSDLSSAEESDEDKGKNKMSFAQMKTGMAGMKLEEPCQVCKKTVFKSDPKTVDVGGKLLHPMCFKCCECGFSLTLKNFKTDANKYYCAPHYPKFKATQALDQTTELGLKNMATTEGLKRFEGVTKKADPKQLAAEREMQQKIEQNSSSWEAQRQARLEADTAKIREEGSKAVETAQAASARNAEDLTKQREAREAERLNQREAAPATVPVVAKAPAPRANPTPVSRPTSTPIPAARPTPTPVSKPAGGPPSRGAPPSGPGPRAPPRKAEPEPEPEPEPELAYQPEPEPEPEPEPYQAEPEPEPARPPPGARPPPKGAAPPGPRVPPRSAAPSPKFPVGTTCLALYPADGGMYPAIVTSIEDGQYYITYTEYDEAGGPFSEDNLKSE